MYSDPAGVVSVDSVVGVVRQQSQDVELQCCRRCRVVAGSGSDGGGGGSGGAETAGYQVGWHGMTE